MMWGQRASDIKVYNQTPRIKKISLQQKEMIATIFIRITALSRIVLSEFKQLWLHRFLQLQSIFHMFGEFIPFHNSGICFRTTSLYLPMPHLSSKLIWTCSLCGEDIHSLISCLCVAGIDIICQFAFCNHIVWFCPSFHGQDKSFM